MLAYNGLNQSIFDAISGETSFYDDAEARDLLFSSFVLIFLHFYELITRLFAIWKRITKKGEEKQTKIHLASQKKNSIDDP